MKLKVILFLTLTLATVLHAHAQETDTAVAPPDTTLHLPVLNQLGQMQPLSRWPMSYSLMGLSNWDLHRGLNVSLGASVMAGFGKHAPSGAGFAQNVSGMYALPLTPKLSLAAGAYFVNADWSGHNLRDAGLSAVLGYRFNDRWEGYVYGQKSLMQPKTPWPFYDLHELGDRIGAAVRYNVTPSFSIQVNLEYNTSRMAPPAFGPHDRLEARQTPWSSAHE